MFEPYFGFTQTPFTRAVAPASLYGSQQHQELLARLRYLVQRQGFGLITGDVGAGKSTAVRALAATLDGSRNPVLYVSQSGLTPRNLYRDIGLQLGLDPSYQTAEARRDVTAALWEASTAHDRRPLIVIDEAHLLSPTMLEEIRFLANFSMDSTSPMALCLVGQPELRAKLRLRAFEAISQRVNLRYHLTGLPEPETKAYIHHHVKVAGVSHHLFSAEAIQLIHQFTKGIPRRINNLATACLLAGFAEQKNLIDEATVRKAVAEFQDDLGG
jgi:type II secretory pathway predicted ATPase ExeA